MHAYLFVGNDTSEVENKVGSLILKLKGKPIEFSINKIEAVRDLNKFLSLTQPENTIIVLRNIEKGTPDALNAFLKNLEEPQNNVTFILTAVSEYKVLPTILSRCQIIRVGSRTREVFTPEQVGSENDSKIQKFIDGSTGERFKIIDKIKKREEAVDFVKNLISSLHHQLVGDEDDLIITARNLKYLQNTLDALNQNGNVTIQLANLIVHLDIN